MLWNLLAVPIGVGLVIAALLAILLIIPTPLRPMLRATLAIRSRRIKNQVTTPIERELELVAAPQKVIDDSTIQVQDLRGTLLHERNVLLQRQDDLTEAEAQYYKASDDKSDTGIDVLVQLVAEKEQDVAIQQGVVDGIQTAVAAACGGVDQARKELRRVQMTIKSDEAKAKATTALDAAAKVMEAARSMSVDGGVLRQASGEVNHDFEQARARLDGMNGSPAERELKAAGDQKELAELRERLDAKRAAAKSAVAPVAPAQSQS